MFWFANGDNSPMIWGKTSRQELHPGLPCWRQGPTFLGSLLLLFQVHYRGMLVSCLRLSQTWYLNELFPFFLKELRGMAVFHLLVPSSVSCSSWSWANLQLGARSFLWLALPCGCRSQGVGPYSVLCQALSGSLPGSGAARTVVRRLHCRGLTCSECGQIPPLGLLS